LGRPVIALSLNRRQLTLGLTASGLALACEAIARPLPAAPRRAVPTVLRGLQPCRFGQVHYRFIQPATASEKVPLLCLHASPGSSLVYADFLPAIGTDRTVFAADTPGYGLSDRPTAPSTIADFAGAMGDLIAALGLKQVDVLGNHTSSATAVELARQQPGVVRRIVLHSALMFTGQDRAAYRAKLPDIVPPDHDTAAKRLPDLWQKFAKMRAEQGDERAWARFWEMNRDPVHIGWGYAASFEYDFAKTLVQLAQPTLILNPRDELFAITARANGVMRNGRVLDLPWTGGTFGVHVAEVATLVRDFLDG
jgi:pimeloyl-ACP methyl ester carboxylesterase